MGSSGVGRDPELEHQARLFMAELGRHGVTVTFDYALEAVAWEAVETGWASPSAVQPATLRTGRPGSLVSDVAGPPSHADTGSGRDL